MCAWLAPEMRDVVDLLRKSADPVSCPEDRKPCQALAARQGVKEVASGTGSRPKNGKRGTALLMGHVKRPRLGFRLRVLALGGLFDPFGCGEQARARAGGGGAAAGRFGAGFGTLRRSRGRRGILAAADIVGRGPAGAGAGLQRRKHRSSHTFHRPGEGQQEERNEAEDQAQPGHLSFPEMPPNP